MSPMDIVEEPSPDDSRLGPGPMQRRSVINGTAEEEEEFSYNLDVNVDDATLWRDDNSAHMGNSTADLGVESEIEGIDEILDEFLSDDAGRDSGRGERSEMDIDDENSIVDGAEFDRRPRSMRALDAGQAIIRRNRQREPESASDSAEQDNISRPWRLSHVYCLASIFVALLTILAAPIPDLPHMGLMKDLRQRNALREAKKQKSANEWDNILSSHRARSPAVWSLESMARAAALSVETRKKRSQNLPTLATSRVSSSAQKNEKTAPINPTTTSEEQRSEDKPDNNYVSGLLQKALQKPIPPPDAARFANYRALQSLMSVFDALKYKTQLDGQSPSLGKTNDASYTKKPSAWLRLLAQQDAYRAMMVPIDKKTIPQNTIDATAALQNGKQGEPDMEANCPSAKDHNSQPANVSWVHRNMVLSPYLKWIDPVILHPTSSTPTHLVNKVISSRPRLVVMANLFLSLTYLLHAFVAGFFLGTIYNRSNIRRGENAIIMGGRRGETAGSDTAQSSGLVIDWTGAAGVRERIAVFLIFKMLLMAQVVDIPENFSFLLLLTWYTCLSCLRSWDHLSHATTIHFAASGQSPRPGVLQLQILILLCDVVAASSCVGLFYPMGISMVVLLICDCALVAVDVTCHILKHFMCKLEDTHARAVTRLQTEQLSRHRSQRRLRGRDSNDELDNAIQTDDTDRQIELLEYAHERRLSVLDKTQFALQVLHDFITIAHFLHIWCLHGVQFTLIDGVLALHLHSAFSSACRKIAQRHNANCIARDLDNIFPDASEVELSKADVCCICLGHMSVSNGQVKKVGCGHMYHAHCLREVVERAHSIRDAKCPLCRASVSDGSRSDGNSAINAVGLQEQNSTQPAFQQPQLQQPAGADDQANERALFRFTTESFIPMWLPIPAFSFEVVRRPPQSSQPTPNGNEDATNGRQPDLRQDVAQQPQDQPNGSATGNLNNSDTGNSSGDRAAGNGGGQSGPRSPVLRRLLMLAGAVPMSPDEEARALTHLGDMFPQYDRRDLLTALRDRGSVESVVESILLGTFVGVPR